MIELKAINKTTIVLLYLLASASLLYSFEAIQSIIIALTSLFLLLNYRHKNDLFSIKTIPFFICFSVLLGTNLLYFSSKSIQIITNSLLLFIVPLSSIYLYQSSLFIKNQVKIFATYCCCIFILSIYCIGFYIKDIPNHHFNWYFARFNLENNIHIHGTYISLWIAIAFLITTYQLQYSFQNLKNKIKYPLFLVLLIYLAALIIINSRAILFSILFLVSFQLYHLFFKKNRIKFLIAITILILTTVLFSQRYLDDINYFYQNNIINSTRYTLCYCSFETIMNSPFFGMNNSLIQSQLNDCYTKYGFENLAKENLNSHNQYLDFFLKGGILLFLAFIWILFTKLKLALKTKNYLYFSITLLFVFSFLTENVLVRQYGIYIYFLCDVLLLGSVFRNESHSTNKVEEG